MPEDTEKIPLPPGYTVKYNSMVGYEFLDGSGNVVMYHPNDSESIRKLIWHNYKVKEARLDAR